MNELGPADRQRIAQILGMKLREIVAAVAIPVDDSDDIGAVVRTHDGQCVLIAPDGEVSPWDGPLPGTEDAVDELPAELEDGDEHAGSTPDPDAVPVGTVDEVLAWVGGDKERAARALKAEQDGKNRSGLTAQLEKLAGLA